MAEEYYLIKGETLTNIADTMRNVFGINEEFRGDQIATRIAGEVDNVYDSAFDDGYAEGLVDGSLNSNGTVGVWEFYDNLVIPEEFKDKSFYFGFNAIAFGTKRLFNEFNFNSDGETIAYYSDNYAFEDVYTGGWNFNDAKIISILEEPLDEEFIEWLKANARRLDSDETYEQGFDIGMNTALEALYDVEIYAGTGFEMFIYNYHPTYYLRVEVNIVNESTGDSNYYDETVPPNGSFYFNGDNLSERSSNEWFAYISSLEWTDHEI